MGEICKIREGEKSVFALSLLISVMLELQTLAEKHNIENKLFYGRSIQKVWGMHTPIGLRRYCELKSIKNDCLNNLVDFLTKEVIFQEEVILNKRLFQEDDKTSVVRKNSYEEGDKKSYNSHFDKEKKLTCILCEESDHTATFDHFGGKVIQCLLCKAFVDMTPKERFKINVEKGSVLSVLSTRCLS